ncbi:ribosomal-protein-alanine N-acetyltransferase [Saccharopolyspora antimicrobica]|uniref:Ribosomal-protein-alanine N-acetyltransferase n=1 Tax=Saccharopolyspora antimicrobica TaxID=455193 RepID=A0A1I5EWI9_9PSEU|nr:GNAT family protein [Saccharopolyspora antimicrobica]RKT83572.1 ribosomal-protein-alanine N-acetyltransferase [Saccharopolyspora antimicrobica]SFO15760.1 ribosomal-protein-alanine N-acetyltransferase [Saccharopolyspora antimicrobica]
MQPTDADGFPVGRHPGWPARLGPLITARGAVALRPPRLRDAAAWSRIRLHDHAYLQQWEPTTVGGWQERNARTAWPAQWAALRGMARRGQALPFSVTVDGEFAGQLTIGNIVRGALRSGWIGYWIAERLAGGGVATAGVALAVDHCFGPVGLHRLEATVRPENQPSVRVLEKSGFRREGLFQRYLDVAGDWRDHYVYALTAEEVPEGAVERLLRGGGASRP